MENTPNPRNWWKIVVLGAIGVVVLLVGGCSLLTAAVILTTPTNSSGGQARQEPQKAAEDKSVAQKQEKAVEAEKKAGESAEPKQSEPSQQQVEEQVRTAAETYYQNAAEGNWGWTYNHLDYETQSTYTEDEWFAKNEYLASTGAVSYTIDSVNMDSDSLASVVVVLTATDGSTSTRNTYFVYEDGSWKHRFGQEEYDLFASVSSASASASASAAPSDSGSEAASGEVEVRVEVSADKPVDVGILSAEDMGVPMVSEQVQSETYTFTKKEGADLSVDASDPNFDMSGDADIHIEVYENGELVAEDSDPVMALVQY